MPSYNNTIRNELKELDKIKEIKQEMLKREELVTNTIIMELKGAGNNSDNLKKEKAIICDLCSKTCHSKCDLYDKSVLH